MKTTTIITSLFTLVIMTACMQEVSLNTENGGEIKTITVIGPSAIQFEPISGGVSTKGTSVQDGNALLFNWAMGDTLGIFPNVGNQVEFPISTAEGGSSASFDGGGWALRDNAAYAAYYPFSVWNYHCNNETILLDYTGQVQNGNGSFAHLSAYDFLASNKTTPQNSTVTFQMERQGSILYIDIVVPEPETINSLTISCDEAIFVEKAALDISGASPKVSPIETVKSLTLSFKNTATTSVNETVRAYMAVQPLDFSDKNVTATLITENGRYSAPVTPRVVNKGRAAFLRFSDNFSPVIEFADSNFKAYCIENFDSDGDGEISYEEARVATTINVNTENIASLKGIECFVNLQSLTCKPNYNGYTPGHSWHLRNSNGEEVIGLLTTLDLSNNTKLITINCSGNQITSLDLSGATSLTSLNCSLNQLTNLEISQSSALNSLTCTCNQLTNLDVSQNIALTEIHCGYNRLTGLDVSHNTALISLDCYCNQLTNLDVSQNTALTLLYCQDNQLTTLDVINNTALTNLSCGYNRLSSLEVINNTALNYLGCDCNQLTSLDVSKNTKLSTLTCAYNQLTSLDVSKITNLTRRLDCSPMDDLSGNNLLQYLIIAIGQNIPNITENRSTDYIPSETEVVTNVIRFADAEVKRICVENWDTDRDSELSYTEAAAVTSLEDVFSFNNTITSFNELAFFTGLTEINDDAFMSCLSLTSIEIPSGVTTIGEKAFDNCQNLSGITLPIGLTSIERDAFEHCHSLTSIELPLGVTTIGADAFHSCISLSSITIPVGVISIENSVFRHCESLTSIEIPSGVTIIGECAFESCRNLSSISFPIGLTSIERDAFRNCVSLTSIELPLGVTTIGADAFAYCESLSSVEIPLGVSTIGDNAFDGCTSLSSITIPSGVTSIGRAAFYNCSSLTSIKIPSGITKIKGFTFYGCSGLTSIEIPSGVAIIGSEAFNGCRSLTSIIIPSSVIEIQNKAFYNCSSLTAIIIQPIIPTVIGSDAFSGSTCFIQVPPTSVDSYKTAEGWSSYADRIIANQVIEFEDSTVKSICISNWDVNGDGKLSLAEAASVNTIGTVFKDTNITSFEELKYFIGLTSIISRAFMNCKKLTSIEIPSGISQIEGEAFFGCSLLSSINIPSGVTAIGACAFYNCISLTSLEIPSGITVIENMTFYGCRSLSSITIPSGVTIIRAGAFEGCSGITSIEIPSGVTNIENAAFCDCSGLTDIMVLPIVPPTAAIDIFVGSTCNIKVPASSVELYKTAPGWNEYAERIVGVDVNGIGVGPASQNID